MGGRAAIVEKLMVSRLMSAPPNQLIRGWNRFGIAFQRPGDSQSQIQTEQNQNAATPNSSLVAPVGSPR